jgi:hypothetical protein
MVYYNKHCAIRKRERERDNKIKKELHNKRRERYSRRVTRTYLNSHKKLIQSDIDSWRMKAFYYYR